MNILWFIVVFPYPLRVAVVIFGDFFVCWCLSQACSVKYKKIVTKKMNYLADASKFHIFTYAFGVFTVLSM